MADADTIAGKVVLGKISGPFGVRGWVKVYSYTDPREAILGYEEWWLHRDDGWQAVSVAEGKRHGRSVIARLDGIDDREQAASLHGIDIAVPRDKLPEPDRGHYYWRDLEGLKVVNRDGADFGTVAYMMETGTHDVLVARGDRERLIPFVAESVILEVDLDAGVITVDWDWD